MGKKIVVKKRGGGVPKIKKPAPAEEDLVEEAPASKPRAAKKVLGKKKPIVGTTPVKKKAAKGAKLAKPVRATEAVESESAAHPITEAKGAAVEELPSDVQKSILASKSDMAEENALFRFYCYRCGQKLKVKTSSEGRQKTCPRCKSRITVPSPPEA